MNLLENTDNLMLAVVPESLALLLFGISLIAFTVGIRWIFDRKINASKVNVESNRVIK
jgi:uncharacterized membrane protein YqjE